MKAGWRYIDPQEYSHGWHLEAVAEHLEAVTRGNLKRLIINVPPRTSKSSLVSVTWPIWTWAQSKIGPLSGPQVQFLFASYAQSLALRDSVKSRRLVESPFFQRNWGDRFALTGDQNTKIRFENDKGGYRLATSVGGALTGEGAQIVVCDDPHNAGEVESELIRENTLQWWDEALSTRLNDPKTGAFVVIMQRLHERDLTGHILAKQHQDWEHLMLPMRYEIARKCYTSLGFSDPRKDEGELLCPDRFDEPTLRDLESRLGPYAVAGQLQQRPEVRGGAIIKREWWQTWEGKWPRADFTLAALDSAYTEKAENDPSALTVWRCYTDKEGFPKIVLCAAWEKRLQLNGKTVARLPGESDADYRARASQEWGLVDWVADTCNELQVDRLLIEAKASGISVAQEIKRLHATKTWGVRLVDPKGRDKVARAHAVTSLFVDGLIYAPDRDWARAVIDQCAAFPRGAHDDLVDSTVYALDHLRSIGLAIRGEEHEREIAELMKPPERHEPVYEV